MPAFAFFQKSQIFCGKQKVRVAEAWRLFRHRPQSGKPTSKLTRFAFGKDLMFDRSRLTRPFYSICIACQLVRYFCATISRRLFDRLDRMCTSLILVTRQLIGKTEGQVTDLHHYHLKRPSQSSSQRRLQVLRSFTRRHSSVASVPCQVKKARDSVIRPTLHLRFHPSPCHRTVSERGKGGISSSRTLHLAKSDSERQAQSSNHPRFASAPMHSQNSPAAEPTTVSSLSSMQDAWEQE